MKKAVFIFTIFIGFINIANSQNIDTIITHLTGKWDWITTNVGGYTMDWITPLSEGYNKSVLLYQEQVNEGSDSINYVALKNDTIEISGKTFIDYRDNHYFINTDIINWSYIYPTNLYLMEYPNDSTIWFYCPYVEGAYYKYQKDKSFSLRIKEDILNKFSINIYPNPAIDYVYIDLSSPIDNSISINIYNMHGQLMFSDQIEMNMCKKYKIDFSKFKPGLYLMHIISKDKVINDIIIKN